MNNEKINNELLHICADYYLILLIPTQIININCRKVVSQYIKTHISLTEEVMLRCILAWAKALRSAAHLR